MARKSSKSTPVLKSGILYTDDDFTGAAIESPRWREFLETGQSFYYDGLEVQFTARREKRRRGVFWYAFRTHQGKQSKRYIGRSEDVTAAKLRDVAASFQNNLSNKESRS